MTLEELIISFDRPGYTPKKLADAILSWFKEQLPKEKEETIKDNGEECFDPLAVGYNQCLQDILTNLTAKQGER
jgi:hypothetical protein